MRPAYAFAVTYHIDSLTPDGSTVATSPRHKAVVLLNPSAQYYNGEATEALATLHECGLAAVRIVTCKPLNPPLAMRQS
jgi:hypothetical protein